jgi:DNA-binding MarR family transcriptional regulator/predicted GNAT family acetyltransferase
MNLTASPSLDLRIASVRRFSRFYTRVIGALREGLLQSRFSLAEARVLYELAHRNELTATELSRDLEMDAGYLSRMLLAFERDGLLARSASGTDRRQNLLSLTTAGADAFAPLDARSRAEVGTLLAGLSEPAQSDLITAMQRIEALLGSAREPAWLLRQHRPGDIGWVIARHGALYADEYAFDHRFEALVAQVAGGFLAEHDPARERCWIAERDGVNVGSVFLVRKSDDMAKLRLLIVEPTARGLGIGRRLVAECIAFARQTGYRGITLWTNDILLAARSIYQQAGFRLVATNPHSDFGPRCVGEDWELTLR